MTKYRHFNTTFFHSLVFYFSAVSWLRAFLIKLSKTIKDGDGMTLLPADDNRFIVWTCNQTDHLVVIYLGALVSRCIELLVTSCQLLALLGCWVKHDHVAEIDTAIPAQYGYFSVVDRDNCRDFAWGQDVFRQFNEFPPMTSRLWHKCALRNSLYWIQSTIVALAAEYVNFCLKYAGTCSDPGYVQLVPHTSPNVTGNVVKRDGG